MGVEGTVKCKSGDLDPTNSLDLEDDVEKHCFCRTPRLQDQWDEPRECATQGNKCRCDGQIRYGAQGFWSAWQPAESSSPIDCAQLLWRCCLGIRKNLSVSNKETFWKTNF